jgi:ketosteroid isomerase-like protein
MPVLAIALVGPAWAQPTNTVDPQTRQQVEAIVANYVGAVNKGDGQTLAALYAANFISITPNSKRTTGAEVQDEIAGVHKRGLALSAKVDDVEPLFGGQGLVATAPYEGTFANDPGTPHVRGNFLFVLERAGDSWKVRIFTASRLVPAPAR